MKFAIIHNVINEIDTIYNKLKVCPKCLLEKYYYEYGSHTYCLECQRTYQKENYNEEKREYQKRYQLKLKNEKGRKNI